MAGGAGTGRQLTGRSGSGTALATRGQGQSSLLPAFMASPGLMASAFMSNPFAFAQAMSQEMDRLFSSSGLGDFGSGYEQLGGGSGRGLMTGGSQRTQQGLQQGGRGLAQWTPQMEISQRGNELVVRADLPGLRPEDVQIDVEDGVLTVWGERVQSNEDRQEGIYRSERSYGAFSRSIPLPDGVDEDQIQARFEHGELEITVPLPQQQRSRGRRVQVQAGRSQGSAQQLEGREGRSGGQKEGEAGQQSKR